MFILGVIFTVDLIFNLGPTITNDITNDSNPSFMFVENRKIYTVIFFSALQPSSCQSFDVFPAQSNTIPETMHENHSDAL